MASFTSVGENGFPSSMKRFVPDFPLAVLIVRENVEAHSVHYQSGWMGLLAALPWLSAR